MPVRLGKQIFGREIGRRHWAAMLGVLVAGMLVLAWTLLPGVGLRWGLVETLRRLGMVDVSVSDADLSLFRGNVVVRQMVARPAMGAPLGIKDFTLRFRWAPLLNKRVALEGVEVDIRRENGGFVVNGLPLAIAAAPPGQPAEAGSAWGIDIGTLDLSDSRLVLTDGDARAEIAVQRLTMENLHSRDPASAPRFTLLGTLNGAGVTLTGSASPFAADPAFNLDLALHGLDLAPLRAIAAQAGLGGLGGHLDLALTATGTLGDAGLALRAGGRLEASDPTLATPVAITAKRLALDLHHADWSGGRLDLAAGAEAGDLRVKTTDGGEGSAAGLKLEIGTLSYDGTRLDLVGRLEGTAVAVGAQGGSGSAAGMTLDAARLVWDGKLDWQGGLGLTGIKLAVGDMNAQPDSLAWSGRLTLDPKGGSPQGRAEGRLDLGPLRLALGDIAVAHKHAVTEGWVEFGHVGPAPLTAGLKLTTEGLRVSEPARGQGWLALERLDLSGIAAAADGGVAIERVLGTGLAALRRDGKAGYPWRIEARSLRLDHLARNGDGDMAAAEARVDGLTARVTRTRNGLLGLPAAAKPSAPASPSAEDDTPGLSLGRLTVGGDSKIVFEDGSSGETVRLEAQPVELSVVNLDSDHPDRDSGFDLKASIGEASIAAAGVARPFADPVSGRIDGRITALELPPLSPYLAEALGVHLQTGHFDGTFKGGVVKGALDGKLNVNLSNLFIAPPDPNAPIAKKLDMPIETVLDLLRDGKDRIRLSLPIRGDLANPDLDISDAVAQAVAGALKSTVMTTLKLAFPVVTLISMAVDAEDQSRLALAPLAFAPGADDLSDDHRKTLTSVAELMRARPGLTLTLCGKADAVDWPPLAERRRAAAKPLLARLERMVGVQRDAADAGPADHDALAGLADSRAAAAKEFLVDKGGIDPGRLFACRAEVEAVTAADKGPRVELLL